MKRFICCWLLFVCSSMCVCCYAAEELTPGEPIDFSSLAFYPDRWKEHGVEMKMVPWQGEQVVFLTTTPDFDGKVMAGLLQRLDGGWKLYAELTGKKPGMFKQLDGKPTLAAISEFKLTCGYGCGMVGATGIELGAFYRSDYKDIVANPNAVPDYYFYEMGRNYYTFGNKHSQFTTGFAVFMRYVCVDNLGLKTSESIRSTIEKAESLYVETDLTFMQAFTTLDGYGEKKNRLEVNPSDQNVIYASAMLKLHRELGGDKWLKRFYQFLDRCPAVKPVDKAAAMQQVLSWYVAASCAAKRDLSDYFVDRWRLPMSEAEREVLAKIDWAAEDVDPGAIVVQLRGTRVIAE